MIGSQKRKKNELKGISADDHQLHFYTQAGRSPFCLVRHATYKPLQLWCERLETMSWIWSNDLPYGVLGTDLKHQPLHL